MGVAGIDGPDVCVCVDAVCDGCVDITGKWVSTVGNG